MFKKTAKNRIIFFVAIDIILITISIWLSFLIRFDGDVPKQYNAFILEMIALAVILIVPVFYSQRLYSFSWSYVSANELISLFKATTISFIFLGIIVYILKSFSFLISFPRSILFISYFLIFILCGGFRFSKRIYLHIIGMGRMSKKEKTLIVGAGDAGEQILRSVLSSNNSPYSLIGFVDDSLVKQGVNIHGVKVLGKLEDIPKIVADYQVKQLIIAIPSAGNAIIKKAVDLGKKSGLKKIKIAPSISEIINGRVSLRDLKDVGAEDLLGRTPVVLDTKEIERFIKDKIVLITGAAGSIGSELSRQIARFKPSLLLLLDQDETGLFNISEEIKNNFSDLKIISSIADITDEEKIKKIFKEFQPNVIFHAAAYKHVPLMEENPDEAVKNNILGTENIVRAALYNDAEKFIFISTDKAVNPKSIMGATKRIGEMIYQTFNQKNNTKFISVRFGNVLDSRGSVIPTFREQIRKKEPVTVTHPDMKRYFMLISEACLLVMQAGAMGQGGEVFVLDMGEPIKILDLAKEMIKLAGFEPDKDIPIVFTEIRPGEKLFEEILTAEEGTIATKNKKIFMAKLSNVNNNELENKLEKLKSIASEGKMEEIKKTLENLFYFYKPNK
ncbi:polysaccharide biosynthesis protein [Patescibacteria group bacterium]|nr:polysaccharide biosynthesis protein [Patescibacteria group bacterium]